MADFHNGAWTADPHPALRLWRASHGGWAISRDMDRMGPGYLSESAFFNTLPDALRWIEAAFNRDDVNRFPHVSLDTAIAEQGGAR